MIAIIITSITVFFSFCGPAAPRGPGPHQRVFGDNTQTHHTRQDSSGRVIGPTQRILTDNTQHTQEADIHAPSGIRTLSLSKRAAADSHVRPTGHRDQPSLQIIVCYCVQFNLGTVIRKRAFVVDVLTRLRAERYGVRFPAEAGDLYHPKRPGQLWGPPSLLFDGYRRLFSWG